MRCVRRCTKADKIKNETIRSDLNIFQAREREKKRKTKWKDHVDRMIETDYQRR